ncbi:MAG: hypothetical protein C6H99_02240 [Epsilonproteobacteria bacterium]|nr:hypothetical protein [Campylobacterota bacterium]NPA64072.1 hypothetical protein [Campylobacterota bacterium]
MFRLITILTLLGHLWASDRVAHLIPTPSSAIALDPAKALLLVSSKKHVAIVYDISKPLSPKQIGRYLTSSNVADIALWENYALLLLHGLEDTSTITILDISDPASPTPIGQKSLDQIPLTCAVENDFVVVASYDPTSARDLVSIIDLQDPTRPTVTATSLPPAPAKEISTISSSPTYFIGLMALGHKGIGAFEVFWNGTLHAQRIPLIPGISIETVSVIDEEHWCFGGSYLTKTGEHDGGLYGITDGDEIYLLDRDLIHDPILAIADSTDLNRTFAFTHDSLIVVDNHQILSHQTDSSIAQNLKIVPTTQKAQLLFQTISLDETGTPLDIAAYPTKDLIYLATERGVFVVDTNTSRIDLRFFLLTKTFQKSGTFTPHDFDGVDEAFDWIFVTPSHKVYQLQGASPTQENVFGWKRVDITPRITPDSWNMIYLGDYDKDKDGRFDWVLYKNVNGTDKIYKLSGITPKGTFKYQKIEGLKAKIEENSVSFWPTTL